MKINFNYLYSYLLKFKFLKYNFFKINLKRSINQNYKYNLNY